MSIPCQVVSNCCKFNPTICKSLPETAEILAANCPNHWASLDDNFVSPTVNPVIVFIKETNPALEPPVCVTMSVALRNISLYPLPCANLTILYCETLDIACEVCSLMRLFLPQRYNNLPPTIDNAFNPTIPPNVPMIDFNAGIACNAALPTEPIRLAKFPKFLCQPE